MGCMQKDVRDDSLIQRHHIIVELEGFVNINTSLYVGGESFKNQLKITS